jgi:hypothetical protein
MNKTTFDRNGIFASDAKLTAIALQVLEQEKRERELRREWFSKWNDTRSADGGQWGIWHISDRD